MPFDIFINYRRDDTLAMAVVLQKFLEMEFADLQVFLDLEGIQGGDHFPDTIQHALRESKLVLTLVGEKFLSLQDPKTYERRIDTANDWVRQEIEMAMQLATANAEPPKSPPIVMPLLVDGATMPAEDAFNRWPLLAAWTKRNARAVAFKNFDSDFKKLVAFVEEKLGKTRKNAGQTKKYDPLSLYPLPEDINPLLPDEEDEALSARDAGYVFKPTPYLGLRYFRRRDAPLFFGRSREILRFFELVNNPAVRIIRLYGPSGVGKSSLLAAGLLPRLERQHISTFYRRRNKVSGMHQQLDELAGTATDAPRRVYILDQAEEMFTDPLQGEKEALHDTIRRVLAADEKATIVLGFRSDYLVELKGLLKPLFPFQQEDLSLDALTSDALEEAVEGVWRHPSLRAYFELDLEEGFAGYVARDLLRAESGGATSILQNRLLKLYEESAARRNSENDPIRLTIEAYKALTRSNLAEEELLNYQLARLRGTNTQGAPDEKSLLEVLHKFVLDKPTAGTVPKSKLPASEDALHQALRRVNLLAEIRDPAEALRLSHDLLAPVVRRRYDALLKAEKDRLQIENLDLLLDRIRQNLPELKFEEVFADLRQSMALGIHPERLSPIAFELAFVYLHASKSDPGRELAERYAQLERERNRLISPLNPENLLAWLKGCDPNSYIKLEARYFPELRHVEGGTFEMGDVLGDGEHPDKETVHPAAVASFQIAATPTTWYQYGLYCFARGLDYPNDSGWGRGDRPVIHVNWYDAVQYANWLNQQRGIPAWYDLNKDRQDPDNLNKYYKQVWTVKLVSGGWGFRLPTEAEWEYAAREAGSPVRFGNGAMVADPAEMNFNASESKKNPYSKAGEYRGRTTPVKQFRPNVLDLYDMSGNVWEWCQDWHGAYPESGEKGYQGPKQGSDRVLRGGCWDDYSESCRVADRFRNRPGYRFNGYGFRLVFVPQSAWR